MARFSPAGMVPSLAGAIYVGNSCAIWYKFVTFLHRKRVTDLNVIVAVVIALILGFLLNLLANWLPTFSPTYRERKTRAELEDRKYGPSARVLQIRYALVMLTIVAAAIYLWGRGEDDTLFGPTLGYVAIFLLIIVIDVEYLIIPDVLIVPAFLYALIEIIFTRRISIQSGLAGYAGAQITLSVVYIGARVFLALVNRGRAEEAKITATPFGFGDVTLATFCGLIVGLGNIPFLIILMILFGALTAIGVTFGRLLITRKVSAYAVIPYGPAIVLSAAALLLWEEQVAAMIF